MQNLVWKCKSMYLHACFLLIRSERAKLQIVSHRSMSSTIIQKLYMKQFSRYWLFVRWIHQSTVNSPHKVEWRGALMFSLVWINGWVNNREAGDVRRHRVHYDVTVMGKVLLRADSCQTLMLINRSNTYVYMTKMLLWGHNCVFSMSVITLF